MTAEPGRDEDTELKKRVKRKKLKKNWIGSDRILHWWRHEELRRPRYLVFGWIIGLTVGVLTLLEWSWYAGGTTADLSLAQMLAAAALAFLFAAVLRVVSDVIAYRLGGLKTELFAGPDDWWWGSLVNVQVRAKIPRRTYLVSRLVPLSIFYYLLVQGFVLGAHVHPIIRLALAGTPMLFIMLWSPHLIFTWKVLRAPPESYVLQLSSDFLIAKPGNKADTDEDREVSA